MPGTGPVDRVLTSGTFSPDGGTWGGTWEVGDNVWIVGDDAEVRTGHGDSTRTAAEAPQLQEWIARHH